MHEINLYQALPGGAPAGDWPGWVWDGSDHDVQVTRSGQEYTEYEVPDYEVRGVTHTLIDTIDDDTRAGLAEFSESARICRTSISVRADGDGLIQATKDLYDPSTLVVVDGRPLVTDAPIRSCVVLVGDGLLQRAHDIVTPEFLVRLSRKDVEVDYAGASTDELDRTSDLNRPRGQVCFAWADMTVWLPAAPKFDRMFRGSVDFVNAQVLAMRVLVEDLHREHQRLIAELYARSKTEPASAEQRLQRLRKASEGLIDTRRALLVSVELPTRRLVLGIGGGPMTQYFAAHHENMGISASMHDVIISIDRVVQTVDRLTNLASAEIEAASSARSIRNSRDLRRGSAAAGLIALGIGIGTAGIDASGVDDFAAVAPAIAVAIVLTAVLGLAGVVLSSVANSPAARAAALDDSNRTVAARLVARGLMVVTVLVLALALLLGRPQADVLLLVALPGLYALALVNARLGRFSTAS